ncbi:hypothetical protein FY136_13245 [Agrobacterium tumefaciens]|uniref:hypothetical protein n=1 Tax=Agrobacterium tumefaciens TaxID=358 RepID=UPI0021CFB205|nr:hypothetical protein [Agrobacterium tumefaciens]UXT50154.1 hypothetical protein FY136_13245 [Agrobacterium tumefaciens]
MAIRTFGAGSAPRTVTVTATIRQRASKPNPQPTVIHEPEILPPSPKAIPGPAPVNPTPLSPQTVYRIITRAVKSHNLPDLWIYAEVIRWGMLSGGTTVGIIEHQKTGVRYHFTVCPKTFKPKNLGPIDG